MPRKSHPYRVVFFRLLQPKRSPYCSHSKISFKILSYYDMVEKMECYLLLASYGEKARRKNCSYGMELNASDEGNHILI